MALMESFRARKVISSARTGSSWPLLIDTDGGTIVGKLSGAGQGFEPLIAEVLVGAIAERIGLRVPRRTIIWLHDPIECVNQDPELIALLRASQGANLGIEFINDARNAETNDLEKLSPDDAAMIVWLDWLVMNPDRSTKNLNLLIKQSRFWVIDHGARSFFTMTGRV